MNKRSGWFCCLALVGLGILACLPCFLGLVVLVPFAKLLGAVLYLMMSGQPTADQYQYQ